MRFSRTLTLGVTSMLTMIGLAGVVIVSSGSADATPAQTYADVVRADGAASHWRLGDAVGSTVALDSIGTKNATYNGATLAQAGALAADTDTAIAGSYAGAVQTPAVPGGVRSIEEWFKVPVSSFGSSTQTILYNNVLAVELSTTGTASIKVSTSTTSTTPATGRTYNDGAWHHLVMVVDTTTTNLYIDAVLVDTKTVTDNATDAAIWTGFYGQSTDEIAVYPTKLTPTQIAEHHRLGRVVLPTLTMTMPTTSVTGQPVNVAVKVAGPVGAVIPTGAVRFAVDGVIVNSTTLAADGKRVFPSLAFW